MPCRTGIASDDRIRFTTHLAQDRAACASGSAPVLAALAAGAAALARSLARDPEPSDPDALARRVFADALAAAPLAALSLPGAGAAPGLAGAPVAVALTPLDGRRPTAPPGSRPAPCSPCARSSAAIRRRRCWRPGASSAPPASSPTASARC